MPSLGRYSPLKSRIFRSTQPASKAVKETTTTNPKVINRPTTYRHWNDVSMREALGAVNVLGMSVSKAASAYGIPRSTLSDHCHGKVLPGVKSGRPTLLSSFEEQDLVQFLLSSARIGCARTRIEVISIVERMLSYRGGKESDSRVVGQVQQASP